MTRVFNSDFTYNVGTANTTAHLPPNGAGAGRTALINDNTGFIDFARSSSARAGTDPASEEFYAFALDAVTWVKFPGNPVANLTQNELIKIFTCDPATGAPFIGNWKKTAAGKAAGFKGGIVKYQAQLSSGRQKTFEQKILNGATVDQNCDAQHLSPRLEESNASGTAAATRAAGDLLLRLLGVHRAVEEHRSEHHGGRHARCRSAACCRARTPSRPVRPASSARSTCGTWPRRPHRRTTA